MGGAIDATRDDDESYTGLPLLGLLYVTWLRPQQARTGLGTINMLNKYEETQSVQNIRKQVLDTENS